MVLLDKKSLKLEGIQDFEWSPAADILCAYQSEQAGGNLPARISLIRLPDRTELRQKNLFSVSGECVLFLILSAAITAMCSACIPLIRQG